MRRIAAVLLFLAPCWAQGSARGRVDAILGGRAPSGSRETFGTADLHAIGVEELAKRMPGVVSNLDLKLGEGWAAASGDVDFLKLRRNLSGDDAGLLWQRILSGNRPVVVRVRLASSGGKARVDVERVTVSGISLEGAGLDFVLRAYVRSVFPDAVPGEWFALDSHVERVALHPGSAVVVVK